VTNRTKEAALAVAQAVICNAMDAAGMSRADLARKMGKKRPYITRILSGKHNLTVKTLAQALEATGHILFLSYVPKGKP
jgi:Predicted transcription regulator containing HTH domain